MSDFMSLGRRIRHYRMLRGMTQKALGIAAGLPSETADIRIAQYESGARTPKYALLCTLAEALCVPPSVLDIPRIKSREALKKLLLALEDEYGLTVTITEATKGAFAMENEKMIKVVLLEPGKLARAVEIDASLAGMQKVVGGLIEPFYPFEEQVCIVCNEESKINGMRPNRSVKNDDGVMVDFIFGPAFICDCRGENLDSLSDEQIDRYGKMFRYPEHLARVNDTLFGIPYRPQPEQER